MLLLLNFTEAVAVTACAPSPEPAVVVNVQEDFAVLDCWWPVKAPATSTHWVSLLVVTVSVSAPPCLANTEPPTLTVPAPPEKTALVTLEAEAVGALSIAITIVDAATLARADPLTPRRSLTNGTHRVMR